MATPRGIRNRNPGNLRKSPEKWLGEVPGEDDAFKAFSEPVYGLRAIAKLLLNYERRYGLNTVSGLINRWAPSSENNTTAYIDAVARACGVSAGDPIDVAAYLPSLIPAIVLHENGMQPYSGDMIAQAIALATGVENAQTPADVVATSPEPAAPGVPASPVDVSGQGQSVGGQVGEALPSILARFLPILKTLSTSKTMAGVVGLIVMQLTGQSPWDIRLWIGGQIYDIPNLHPFVSAAFALLATYGRITAKPVKR